ncbi:odorant receptor 43a-like [Calliopsis andreniformis]|uniref:odorant receptor 43a-like n=1 Tax=Calliopsis andreniformis TaxID=337506 RepID=UPI003FCEC466
MKKKSSVSDSSKENDQDFYRKDISIIATAFLMKFIGLWIANSKEEQRRRNLALFYTVIAIIFGVWVQTRDFYYSWPDFNNCAYVGCNILSLCLILVKLFILIIHRREFIDLILYTYKNFWHLNYDINEKLLLANCKKICIMCMVILNSCGLLTVISYILTPIIANIGKNQSDRIHPFNMRLDLPILTVSPYYEIVFVLQVLSLYYVAVCYISFDYLLCLINLHVTTQFRILQYRLMNIGGADTINRQTFKSCIRQHQTYIWYCCRLEDIFTLVALGHVLIFSLLICLLGYQTFLADSLTRRFTFTFHLGGSLNLLFLFTYSCDGLIQESVNIGTAVYKCPWTTLPMNRAGRNVRKDLQLIIIRSRRPCCLTAGGFFPISLATFTRVLSTGMSYFTLIRQSI